MAPGEPRGRAFGQGDLILEILNAFDEHHSRENAKHSHRAMLGNARQGCWNGAVPPFGQATVVKERGGNKDRRSSPSSRTKPGWFDEALTSD